MTNEEQKPREIEDILADIFTAGGESHEVGGQSFDQLKQSGYIDRKISDLTALISENYVEKAKYDEAVRQRDELKEALAEQKRLYFNLFDEEIRCMYCEAEISRGSAIILCKECAENTEL